MNSGTVTVVSSRLVLFLTWMSFVGVPSSQAQSCDTGWFGPSCVFKCRCSNDACNEEGVCTGQAGCLDGWFGPKCQYVNLASQQYLRTQYFSLPVFVDGDDDTCVQDESADRVTVTLAMAYPITWLRIVVKQSAALLPEDFSINFKDAYNDNFECVNPKHMVINSRTLDIRCDVHEPAVQVVITGQGVKSICSVYISGGRNVALRQAASQSTTYGDLVASKAVDGFVFGNTDDVCMSTRRDGESQYLEVTLSQPQLVNRYFLQNRQEQNVWQRLVGFSIRSFSLQGTEVFSYTNPLTTTPAQRYSVTSSPLPAQQSVSRIRINSRIDVSLTFCELEIYAECSLTSFGADCSGTCSRDCLDQMCHHENGHCYDCPPGKRGSVCDQECPPLTYGKGCKQNCSEHCANDGGCDKGNGTCLHGCIAGYKGSLCDEKCSIKRYGIECLQRCSTTCQNELCHYATGKCNLCVTGKIGEFCENDCPAGRYGQNCSQSCSENCNADCDPRDGTCVNGCKPGYLRVSCETPCPKNKFGQDCLKNCSTTCLRNETVSPTTCNFETGACLFGCENGFTGLVCSTALNERSSADKEQSSIGLIAGIVAAVVVLAVLAVIAVLLWRRRRASKVGGASNQEDRNDETVSSSAGLSNSRERLADTNSSGSKLDVTDESQSNNGPTYYNVLPNTAAPVNTSVPVAELGAYMQSHSVEFFKNQFEQVPVVNPEAKTTAALKPENKSKNRYKNIVAYDHSRVLLKFNEAKQEGDYINASYVEGYKNEEKFIAAQGPNKVTINDFVRMLWEQKAEKVVMLTNLIEEGKPKCERYWPEDDFLEFGGIEVNLSTTQVFADYTIRKLRLEKKGKESHFLTHFHFTSWPDKGVPRTPWALVDFEQRVASYPTSRPVVVHCSAGVGRTGTFIGLRNLMKEGSETGHMDFYNTLVKLRKDRVNMIQTADQYMFLHKAAQVAIVCMGTTVTSNDITERMNTLEAISASGMTNMAKEFDDICTVCADCDEISNPPGTNAEEATQSVYENSRNAINKLKNRFSNVLPKDEHRPHLTMDIKNGGDYINAVFVPSFSKLNDQFLTQLPLPTTVLDFWRLVTQYKVTLIVSFEEESTSDDSTVGSYLPVEKEALTSGPFTIEAGEPKTGSFWEERQLLVTKDPKKTGLSMADVKTTGDHKVFQLKFASFDLDPKTVLTVMKQIRTQTHGSTSHGRTLYMCRNGATYSGLVCVLSLLLDRLDNDLCLTVPLVVGAIKSIRPQVIPTLEQYKLLYDVLKRYTETSTVYCNFDLKPSTSPQLETKPEVKPKPMTSVSDST